MALPLSRVILGVAGLAVLAYAWQVGGRERWRSVAATRLVWGLPWATLTTAVVLLGFYLFAQGGLAHWGDPLTVSFRSWSLTYPLGLLTSGLAHGSPAHLLSNTTGLLVFGSIVEATVGHYPKAGRKRATGHGEGTQSPAGPLASPRVRIGLLVAGLIGLALLTAPFGLGWVLGYSGVVYALAGVAVVTRPLAAVVGVAVHGAMGVLVDAIGQPIVRGTRTAGPPTPPEWAGIAFQGHLLGFVLGVLLGIALVRRRDRWPDPCAVLASVLVFGLAKSLWLLFSADGDGAYVLYRAAGVVGVLLGAVVVAVATTGETTGLWPTGLRRSRLSQLSSSLEHPVRRLSSAFPISGLPDWVGELLAIVLAVVAFPTVDAWSSQAGEALAVGIVAGVAVFAVNRLRHAGAWIGGRLSASVSGQLPRLPSMPEMSRASGVLLGFLLVLALLGAVFSPVTVSTATLEDTGSVTVGEYTVTYAENVTEGRDLAWYGEVFDGSTSGVIVASERRAIWTDAVRPDRLAYDGTATVRVGGLTWERTVDVERTGWSLSGNDTVYAVDLTVDGTTTRSFTSQPHAVDARIDGKTVVIAPTADGFDLRVRANGSVIATSSLPTPGETVSLDSLQFRVVESDDTATIYAETNGTRVRIADEETHAGQDE